jgi:hypothetical protein
MFLSFAKALGVLEGPSLFLRKLSLAIIPTKIQFVLQGPLHFGRSYHISMYCFIVHQLGSTYLSFGKGQCVLQRLLFSYLLSSIVNVLVDDPTIT